MTLTNHLIDARKRAGLSQGEVAEALNVSRQAVSRWETGLALPSTDNLAKLSKLYGISIDALLGSQAAPLPTNESTETDTSAEALTPEDQTAANSEPPHIDDDSPTTPATRHDRRTRKTILALGVLCVILAVTVAVLLYQLYSKRAIDFDDMEITQFGNSEEIGTFSFSE